MKTSYFAALGVLLCTSQFAFADGPFVEVKRVSGYVLPDYRYSLDCKIEETYTEHRAVYGFPGKEEANLEKTVYTARVPSRQAALALIRQAAEGSLILRTGPTDGPTTTVTGVLEGPVVDRHVKILRDFSDQVWTNSASGTSALIEFADLNCPAPQGE